MDEIDLEKQEKFMRIFHEAKKFMKPKVDPTYMGVSDFGVLDEDFDDGTNVEPFYNPSDIESIKKRVFWASQNGRLDVLEEILKDANNLITLSAIDEDGYTPLHRACYNGHLNVVKFLLDKGANARARTKDGWEPIHCASFWSHHECLNALLNYNPLPESSAEIFNETQQICDPDKQNLTKHDIQSTPDNNESQNFLTPAEKAKFIDIKALSPVNSQTNGGLTPLHLACQNNSSRETIEMLMFHPLIDLNIKTPMGDTAADIAKRRCPFASYLFESFDPSINEL